MVKTKKDSHRTKLRIFNSKNISIITHKCSQLILMALLLLISISFIIASTNYLNISSQENFLKTSSKGETLSKLSYEGSFNSLNASHYALNFSTYFGGNNLDWGQGITVDSNGNSYVTGNTYSTNLPIKNAYQSSNHGISDTFVAKFNSTGVLVFSTYLGGSNSEQGYGIAVDKDGNSCVTGLTSSTNFPTKNAYNTTYGGNVDAFVAEFNSTGALIFSTYFGGNNFDTSEGVAIDGNGSCYVTGVTSSTNFPTKNAYQNYNSGNNSIFVAKFNSTGTLIFSTYLGGSNYDGGFSIAVDSNGNSYITGQTSSTNFPTKNAYQTSYGGGTTDAYVAKFNSTGALVFSTYLGGNAFDNGYGIAVDNNGTSYITGYTFSINFPTKNFPQSTLNLSGGDIFLTEFNSTGALVFSRNFGGNNFGIGYGIAVDNAGNSYVTGQTDASNFPTKNPCQASYSGNNDAFLAKFNSTGVLVFSTYLGGTDSDQGMGIVVDSNGNNYLIGFTSSSNFPTKNAFDGIYDGNADAFIVKFTPSNSSTIITIPGTSSTIIPSSSTIIPSATSVSTISSYYNNLLNLSLSIATILIVIIFIVIGLIIYRSTYKKRSYYENHTTQSSANIDGIPSSKYTIKDSSTRFCSSCGEELMATDVFCPNCGTRQL